MAGNRSPQSTSAHNNHIYHTPTSDQHSDGRFAHTVLLYYCYVVPSSSNRILYLQHDAHQALHRRLPPTPGRSETIPGHPLRQYGHCLCLVHRPVLLGRLPVPTRGRPVGFHHSRVHVCLGATGRRRGVRPVRVEHHHGLAVCAVARAHDLEGQDDEPGQDYRGGDFGTGDFVSFNLTLFLS